MPARRSDISVFESLQVFPTVRQHCASNLGILAFPDVDDAIAILHEFLELPLGSLKQKLEFTTPSVFFFWPIAWMAVKYISKKLIDSFGCSVVAIDGRVGKARRIKLVAGDTAAHLGIIVAVLQAFA